MTLVPRILAMVGSRVLYGQERANLFVMETLKAKGCEILAIVEDKATFRIIPQELDKRGIAYVEAPAIGRRADGYLFDFIVGNPIRYWIAKRKLKAIAAEFLPTHIHVTNPFVFLTAEAVAQAELPIIYRIGDKPSTHNVFWRWIWRRIVKRVTHFVAISEFIARELEVLGVKKDRITVIYNAPTARAYPPQPDAPINDTQEVLYIGQLSVDKGVDRLIKAFALIAPEFPNSRLTIVGRISEWCGDDWQRSLRDETCSDPIIGERVQFVGEQDDIYRYLAEAGFLVVPSVIEEALGNVVSEAKAAARPSVVFPSGGLPELIRHAEDGYVCRDLSVEALVEGLRFYLTDPDKVRTHGKAALKSLERLGVGQFAERWRAIYDFSSLEGQINNLASEICSFEHTR